MSPYRTDNIEDRPRGSLERARGNFIREVEG